MKTIKILILLLLIWESACFADTISKTYYFNNYKIVESGDYQIINFKNTLPTGKIGEPTLPYHSVSLLLPPGEVAESIEIVGDNEAEISGRFNLYPQQHSRPISEGKSGKFVKNTAVYESKIQYPTKLFGNLSTHFMNGYAFALSSFTPLKYIPSTGKITFYKKVTVKVFTKSNEESYNALKNLSSSYKVLKRVKELAQNPELMTLYQTRKTREDDYQMLIITPSQFADNYQQLINLYLVRGIKTEVATTEDINSTMPGLDLQEKIRNYIIQEYQTHSIEYVLLGGDVELVPYRGFYCTVESGDGYEDDGIPSDLYYSALDGTWNNDGDDLWGEIGEDDLLPEISVARFTISDFSDLNNMLNKTISYQDNPVTGELRDPLLAGEHLWDDPVTWGGDYLDLLIGYHEDNGYTTDGIPETNSIEKLYDRDIGNWSGATLISKINEGKSFIHHAGHANSDYCMRLNLSDITNSNFYTVNGVDHNFTLVYTHGCLSGAFDVNDCIAERMVNIGNFAAAFVGNSRYGWFNEGQTEGPSEHLHREFVNALYADKTGRIGTTHLESKIATAPWVNAPGQHEEGALRWCFYDCNVLGDPAMSIWTDEPMTIQANYQDSIPIGTPFLSVTVTNNESPTERLNCVLIKDNIIYGTAITDSLGYAEINIEPPITELGEAELIISGYNCLPTTFPITIIPDENSYVILDSFEVSDDNNNIPEYNETIWMNITLKNVGLEEATNVYATLTSNDDFVTISDGEQNVGTVPSEGCITINNAFELEIANNIPDQHQLNFDLEITGNSRDVWHSPLSITVNAPNLLVNNIIINDSEGNNNGVLDPGETAIITFPTSNTGHATSPSATANLSCNNELITIEDDSVAIGQINVDSTANANFTITANNEIAVGTSIVLNYEVFANGYTIQNNFTYSVGLSLEGFETGDFLGYPWEFNGDADWTISSDAYEGNFCAQSGNIGDLQSTSLVVGLDVLLNGEISFWKKVSSENTYDFLRFYIDGSLQGEWSGEINWSEETYPVTSGHHTFKWKYQKDTCVSSGSDCVWIDNIIFPSIAPPVNVDDGLIYFAVTKLNCNYPNPFNPSTTISFSLTAKDAEDAKITIYNIKGQKVKTFPNLQINKFPNQQVVWDGKDENGKSVSSGIYLYKLSTDKKNIIKKMILLK